MEFITKNKKMVIIGLLFAAVIAWFLFNKTDSTTTTTTTVSAADTAIRAKIDAAAASISGSWRDGIIAGAAAEGLTVVQNLANVGLWSLKHDGKIDINTYGAGEWGHKAWIKANY